MDRRSAHLRLGIMGEKYAVKKLHELGYNAKRVSHDNYDILISGRMRVEVKAATLSHGIGNRWLWQFCLRRNGLPFDEDLLIALCYKQVSDTRLYDWAYVLEEHPSHAFIIPGTVINNKLTKISITKADPVEYAGKWRWFLDYWDQVGVTLLGCPELEDEVIPF